MSPGQNQDPLTICFDQAETFMLADRRDLDQANFTPSTKPTADALGIPAQYDLYGNQDREKPHDHDHLR